MARPGTGVGVRVCKHTSVCEMCFGIKLLDPSIALEVEIQTWPCVRRKVQPDYSSFQPPPGGC